MHERAGLKEFGDGEKASECPAVVCDAGAFPRMRRSGAAGDVSGNGVECHKASVNLQFSVPLTLTREMIETPELYRHILNIGVHVNVLNVALGNVSVSNITAVNF